MPTFRVRQGSHVQHVQDSTAKLAARQIGVRGNGTIAVTDLQTETTQYYKFRAPRLSGGGDPILSEEEETKFMASLDKMAEDEVKLTILWNLLKVRTKPSFDALITILTKIGRLDIDIKQKNEAFDFIWDNPEPWDRKTAFDLKMYQEWKEAHPFDGELLQRLEYLKIDLPPNVERVKDKIWTAIRSNGVTNFSDVKDINKEVEVKDDILDILKEENITEDMLDQYIEALTQYIDKHKPRPDTYWSQKSLRIIDLETYQKKYYETLYGKHA